MKPCEVAPSPTDHDFLPVVDGTAAQMKAESLGEVGGAGGGGCWTDGGTVGGSGGKDGGCWSDRLQPARHRKLLDLFSLGKKSFLKLLILKCYFRRKATSTDFIVRTSCPS